MLKVFIGKLSRTNPNQTFLNEVKRVTVELKINN